MTRITLSDGGATILTGDVRLRDCAGPGPMDVGTVKRPANAIALDAPTTASPASAWGAIGDPSALAAAREQGRCDERDVVNEVWLNALAKAHVELFGKPLDEGDGETMEECIRGTVRHFVNSLEAFMEGPTPPAPPAPQPPAAAHSPLPWRQNGRQHFSIVDADDDRTADTYDERDTRLILHRVNVHGQLVAALRDAEATLSEACTGYDCWKRIRSALAAAEQQEAPR